jgi:hypothetical protein
LRTGQGAYPSGASTGLHSKRGLLALPANIKLERKWLVETNALAYNTEELITTVKKIIVEAVVVIQTLFIEPATEFELENNLLAVIIPWLGLL